MHKRDASAETQQERDDFANELAERRKKVEEKLKSIAEVNDSARWSLESQQSRSANAFSVMKNRTGIGPVLSRQGSQKSVRPGMETRNVSTPIIPSSRRPTEEDPMPVGLGKHSNTSAPHIDTRPRAMTHHDGTADSVERKTSQSRPRNYSNPKPTAISDHHAKERDNGAVALGFPDDVKGERGIRSRTPVQTAPLAETADKPRSSSPAPVKTLNFSRTPAFSDPVRSRPMKPIARPPPISPMQANAPFDSRGRILSPPLSSANSLSKGTTSPPRGSGHPPKRVVNKSQISGPTFVHSTSEVASLSVDIPGAFPNGVVPPIPPMNPRRRHQGPGHNIFGHFKSDRSESRQHNHQLSNGDYVDDTSFSADEGRKSKMSKALRKISSENHMRQRVRTDYNSPPPLPAQI